MKGCIYIPAYTYICLTEPLRCRAEIKLNAVNQLYHNNKKCKEACYQHSRTPLGAASAAAKLLQLCLTLSDPIDGSPPGSSIPGILQARTLEWTVVSFPRIWAQREHSYWVATNLQLITKKKKKKIAVSAKFNKQSAKNQGLLYSKNI